jgi:DNA-binding MarR family transcriptional regulator
MPTDDVALADELFAAIGLLRRSARGTAGRPWPVESLPGAQFDLVRLVRRQPGLSVAEAAAQLGLAPNTVSTLVGQLVDAGLVSRATDADDRRVARLSLTAAAKKRADQWHDQRTSLVADAIALLSPSDQKVLVSAIPVIRELATSLPVHGRSSVEPLGR